MLQLVPWTVIFAIKCLYYSRNAFVRHFVRRAINSAQSPIGRNIADIRHRYAIGVIDITVNYVCRQYPFSQSSQEPPGAYWNDCAYPITRMLHPGLPKVMLILWLTHSATVNPLDNLFELILLYSIVPTLLRTNKLYTHIVCTGPSQLRSYLLNWDVR